MTTMHSSEDNKVCEVPDCPGFGTAHPPLPPEQTILVSTTFDVRGAKASDLTWWASKVPTEAEISSSGHGDLLVATWRI